jgi:hypothetical protein
MNHVVSGIEVVKKGALLLKGSPRRNAIGELEALVRPDVNVKLVVHVHVGPSHKDDPEVDSIVGIVERKRPCGRYPDFMINDAVGKDERTSEGGSFQVSPSLRSCRIELPKGSDDSEAGGLRRVVGKNHVVKARSPKRA